MKYLRLPALLAFLAVSTCAYAGSSTLTTPEGVRALLREGEIPSSLKALPKEDPDFPIVACAEALRAAHAGASASVIAILEPLLVQLRFDGGSTENGEHSELIVGDVGSFGLWREIAYLTLGEAYYKQGKDDAAIAMLSGIPKESSLAPVATLELAWAELRKRDTEAAGLAIHRLETDSDRLDKDANLRGEFQLISAFYQLERGDFEKAASNAEAAGLSSDTSPELKAIKIKILAQSYVSLYLKKTAALGFEEKRSLISSILRDVDQVPVAYRDSAFSFLVAETYWHLASILRVENPDTFKADISASLKHSEEWIGPWAARSLREKQPLISEDALFLSVTTLWEQRRFTEAIPRLLALPVLFPKGQFLQDTFQLLADYYFDSGEYANAQKYYAELARVGSEEKAAYGVYKAAWTFYNQDRKWKALRHLERLLVHYRAELGEKTDSGEATGTLVKESQNDMLLILAELLPYKAAFAELDIFGFSKEKRLEIRERLAKTYREIGRYEDSVAVYQELLANSSQAAPPEASFRWLEQLTLVLLSSGKREAIAPAIDLFVPRMPKPESDETKKLHAAMEKQIVTVTLTVHREAKKTDDADIWRATDAIYKSFAKNFPDSGEADVWYYGAQRKEQLGKRFEAMQWYQKSADILAYANRSDAALNVLRLARDLSTDKSFVASQKDLPGFYSGLAGAALTYINGFRDTKERPLAELLMLEFYFKAGQSQKAGQYLIDVFRAEGSTPQHQEQYQAHNYRLYEAARWEEANALAAAIHHEVGENPASKEFDAKIQTFQQETAFQAGFVDDKAKRGQAARDWYGKAIQVPSDATITLKAWHNLLLTFAIPSETKDFSTRFQDFEQSSLAQRPPASGNTLLVDIYERASEVWDAMGFPVKRADALSQAAKLQADPTKSDSLHWDAALAYGNYYQLDRMKAELAALQATKHGEAYFNTKNLVTIARLYFWNGAVTEAWDAAKALASSPGAPPQAYILIGDIYVTGRDSKSLARQAVYTAAREFLTRNQRQLMSNPILQPILGDLLFPQVDPSKLGALNEEGLRSPASDGDAAAGKTPQQQLKLRVEDAAKIIRALDKQRSVLKAYVDNPITQISVSALCAAPLLRRDTIRHLSALKSPKLAAAQWPEFVQKLDTKMSEMESVARQEQQSCDKHKQNLVYMRSAHEIGSPLCEDGASCFPEHPETQDSLFALEDTLRKARPTRLDQVYRYLEGGAWAPAELVAYSSQAVHERSLLLGLIRLAMGDTWNSAPLLTDAELDPTLAPHAQLLLSLIEWAHGYRKAGQDIASANPSFHWEDWELVLLKKIQSEPKLPTKVASESQPAPTPD